MQTSQTVEDLTYLRHVIGGLRTIFTVGAHRTHDRVVCAQRVVIDAALLEADVIVVRADRDVLVLEHRITARKNRDDIAPGRR